MDEWTRAHIDSHTTGGGPAPWRLLASATFEEASVVVIEVGVGDRLRLVAFTFETFDDGERVESDRRFIPQLELRRRSTPEFEKWIALDIWGDMNPEYQVVVGQVRDETATTCRVIYTDRTDSLPVHRGIVIGWVDTARDALYELV